MWGDASDPCRSGLAPAHPPGRSSSLVMARMPHPHPRVGSAAPSLHSAYSTGLEPSSVFPWTVSVQKEARRSDRLPRAQHE